MSESLDISNRTLSESSDTCTVEFPAVVELPEVEIITNEENEKVLLKVRAKLYRLDRPSEDEPPEWKDRGTGELKILKHNENFSVRVVMRRDKTYKVCANHFVTPWMELRPCAGNEKAFFYTVLADFADEIAKRECLAVKFGNIEDAKLFKRTFEEAKENLTKECCLYNGDCDKSEESEDEEESVNQKLKELSVNEEEKVKENGKND